MPRTGDRYTWRGVTITIGEVGPGCRWAMITCTVLRDRIPPLPEGVTDPTWLHEWVKQQHMPDGMVPADWTRERS